MGAKRLQYQERQLMIERGMTPALGDAATDQELVWMAGLAGAIVGFLGLGNLTYYFLVRNRRSEEGTSRL